MFQKNSAFDESCDQLKEQIENSDFPNTDIKPLTNGDDGESGGQEDENVNSDNLYLTKLLLNYTATLSVQDEKILRVICRYSRRKDSQLISLRTPVLFNRSLANVIRLISSNAPVAGSNSTVNGKKRKKKKKNDPRSITDEEICEYIRNARSKESSFVDIFSSFDRSKLARSIICFPRDLALNPRKKVKNQLTRGERDFLYSDANRSLLLDPRFVLVELWHLVSGSVMLNCQDFIRSKALSFTIASLSSNNESIRSVSYSILQRFYRQLESSSTIYLEAPYWLWFLDSLRAYLIKEPNQQLSPLVTTFLTCLLDTLTDPSDVLFGPIREFLTKNFSQLKPRLIANKLKLMFHSTDVINYRHHFNFATKVMQYGLMSEGDFKALNEEQLFDWIMLFTHSRLTSRQETLSLLQIIKSAVSISIRVVKSLCFHCNLLNFILQATLAHAKVTEEEEEENKEASSGLVESEVKEKVKRKRKKVKASGDQDVAVNNVINHVECIVQEMVSYFIVDSTVQEETTQAFMDSNYSEEVKGVLVNLQILRSVIYTTDTGNDVKDE